MMFVELGEGSGSEACGRGLAEAQPQAMHSGLASVWVVLG